MRPREGRKHIRGGDGGSGRDCAGGRGRDSTGRGGRDSAGGGGGGGGDGGRNSGGDAFRVVWALKCSVETLHVEELCVLALCQSTSQSDRRGEGKADAKNNHFA